MKRYGMVRYCPNCDPEEQVDGDYVTYGDALAAIAAARQAWPVGSLQWARASGRPFRRPHWHAFTARTLSTLGGYTCLDVSGELIAYLYADDIDALDYEIQPDGLLDEEVGL